MSDRQGHGRAARDPATKRREAVACRLASRFAVAAASAALHYATATAAPAARGAPATATAEESPQRGEPNAASYFLSKRAHAAYLAKEFTEAARLYRAAYAADPAHPEALYGAGLAEARAGRCPRALRELDRLRLALRAGDPLLARVDAARMRCLVGPAAAPPPSPAEALLPAPAPLAAAVTATAAPPRSPNVSAPRAAPPSTVASPLAQLADRTGAPRWVLPATTAAAAGGALSFAYATLARRALDADLGRIGGAVAADRQRAVNAWGALGIAALVAAVAGLGWHLIAAEEPATLAAPTTSGRAAADRGSAAAPPGGL